MVETHYFKVILASSLRSKNFSISREDFLEQISNQWFDEIAGFQGVQEGIFLPQQRVYETGAPLAFVDPLLNEEQVESIFYFADREGAIEAAQSITRILGLKIIPKVEKQEPKDWNEEWRKTFKGYLIAPFWKISPTWQGDQDKLHNCEHEILLNPGMGFGAGTHGTTELCLRAIGQEKNLKEKRVLDFGSGSGILAIAAAKKMADVVAIEIDEMALDGARECGKINSTESQIIWRDSLHDEDREFDLIVANILAPVLKEYSLELIRRLRLGGRIFLSGLLEGDIKEIQSVYETEFKRQKNISPVFKISNLNEWYLIELTHPQA